MSDTQRPYPEDPTEAPYGTAVSCACGWQHPVTVHSTEAQRLLLEHYNTREHRQYEIRLVLARDDPSIQMALWCARCWMKDGSKVSALFVVAGESRCEYHARCWFGADITWDQR